MIKGDLDINDIKSALNKDGFAIVARVLDRGLIEELIEAVDRIESTANSSASGVLTRDGGVYGARDLLARDPIFRELAHRPEIRRLVEPILGDDAFVVRGLLFDKTPELNWNLPWHQDLTIAVRARCDLPGFGPWTLKEGVPHAHAPSELLGRMLTIRLHLDDCGAGSGPMRVLPGSHAFGRLSPGETAAWIARQGDRSRLCVVPAGGAVLMRPLLLHGSIAATETGRRRTIHLEFAAERLPGGLEWRETCISAPIGNGEE